MATKQLSAKITIGGAIASSFRTMTTGVKGALAGLGKTVSDLERGQRNLGRAIQDFGRAGKNVDSLRSSYSRLTDQLDRTRRAQTRLKAAIDFKDRANAISGSMRHAAATAGIASGAIFAGFMPTIREAKRQQGEQSKIEALGFSAKDTEELIANAKAQRVFGSSILQATETARDLASAFGDTHHAIDALPLALKQRAALGLYDAQHGTHLVDEAAYSMGKVIELRNGTNSKEEYNKQANMAHQVMVATGGRVTGQEMQAALRTGGIAAKAMSDEAFYYGGSHFMQEMGGDTFGTASMSLYQALAQGRTTRRAARNLEKFGLIGDASKVTHDKAGQLTFMNPGAIKGYDTFVHDPQKWVEETFIPALRANGIDPDNMTKVAEVAGMIISNRTGANMLATRVAQRKVVAKETANAARADNIDKGFDRAKESAIGKELNAEARLADLKQRIGNSIMPTYIAALEKVATALEAVTNWAERNPNLFKAITIGAAGLGVALAAAVPVLLVGSTILNTIALMRLAGVNASLMTFNGTLNKVGPAAATASAGILGFIGKMGMVAAMSQIAFEALGAAGLPTPQQIQDQGASVGEQNIRKGEWWKASANLPALDLIKARWRHLVQGKSLDETADEFKNDNYWTRNAPTPPAIPEASSTAAPKAGDTYVTQTNTFHLQQQPGESQDAFVRRILDEAKRAEEAKRRGSLADH